ncbi:hypothetical protein PTTG_08230 [Puccinia triticina 1-1 BBBD Race 1]|uniref:SCA7 domain-containing protein n=2 Tax=Puccinia triticina TaxID=208348 RepID=A0A180GF58_PUCT1|nr:uncharacterized protein PtA15_16A400 [Puccinia triticina]OAV91320.1 hypothetical protein PTTG_08230 [Puccinia triticina 1-1 BBBD Race 1]WAQ92492.1 hypothetical protein PtA15_16A400 [Puccinia triticina]
MHIRIKKKPRSKTIITIGKMQLKPNSSKVEAKLKTINTAIDALKQNPGDRWKTIKQLTKHQQTQQNAANEADHQRDHPAIPVWTQRMETLFGPFNDQLRLIKCDNCGILTRETNSKVGVTHKLNCEILRKSGSIGIISKKFSHFSNLESNSKKRASSEVSLDSIPMKKKKKTTIIDHTQAGGIDPDGPNVINGVPMTQKQIKKALAAAERLERENERKEKKRLEEEARKAKKLSRAKGGPVNVNEQCGVLVPPNNTPCARSLTCKTHSMGAKRSVPGRSAPYDVLLNEWQKKNNPNWGDRKVVTPRVGPGIEPGLSKKKKKELATQVNKNGNNGGSTSGQNDASNGSSTNHTNRNQSGNGSSGNGNNKSGQAKDKDKATSSANHPSKSGTGASKSSAGGGNQGGHGSGSTKKSGGQSGQPTKGEHGRTTSAKLSAANEAKLLGEVDADFYLVVPPKSAAKTTKTPVVAGPRQGPVDRDGDTPMAAPGPEAPADPRPPFVATKEDSEDEASENESDEEFEAVIRGLIVSQNFLHPISLLSSEAHSKNPFPPPPSSSYPTHSTQWSKFTKLGVKESFKNSFKL